MLLGKLRCYPKLLKLGYTQKEPSNMSEKMRINLTSSELFLHNVLNESNFCALERKTNLLLANLKSIKASFHLETVM